MKDMEKKWQARWAEEKIFEPDPDDRKKFFCTFPYPYVNGLPHVGHLFTMMRVDAFARYKRLCGYNVLFPQGWHATGQPLLAAANRVKEGDEKQLGILRDLGVPQGELHKFSDPVYFIEYFAPRYKEDVQNIGMSIDWRREFHTTSLNPQYDAFIRWQFNTLKAQGRVQKGEHAVVWCPKDEMVLGDHDRAQGEGETPQEFLLIKHRLSDGRFLISATLRPDTIMGITNVYVDPKAQYQEIGVGGERWIVSPAAIGKLEEQDLKVNIAATVKGEDLVGQETWEFGDRKVPVLPATFIDSSVGTGVVHSVPSESADDLIALMELKEGAKDEYGVKSMVEAIEPIEILDTPGIGGNPARHFLEKYGVKSQNERKKLEQVRKELYKHSFYNATFTDVYQDVFEEDLTGKKVQECMDYVSEQLIEKGWAARFYELSGRVVCRCQTQATVKIVRDQWFLTYGDPAWKELARENLEMIELYPEKARSQFEHVIGWLKHWACAREKGLGTKLPWDERWVIESLSDSTVYMAYYTISHRIKDVPAEHLSHEFFDYVFLGKGDEPEIPGIDADELQAEFNYWYPLDFRNSGKDLVQNHLTFMMFNHTSIFPKKHWPRGIGVNGWVTVNGQKMSKSLGNVIPLRKMVEEFGADASRITILNGGEGMDDPNWDSDFARGMVPKLDQLVQHANELPSSGEGSEVDSWLVSRMNEIIGQVTQAMEKTNFRTAIQLAFFEYNDMLKWYSHRSLGSPDPKLYRQAVENQAVMLSPFIPHISEEVWESLGNFGFASLANWPKADEDAIDEKLHESEVMIKEIVDQLRKKEGFSRIDAYLSSEWKREAYRKFDEMAKETRHPGEVLAGLMRTELKAHGDELSRLVKFMVRSRTPGPILTAEEEKEWLGKAKSFIEQTFDCTFRILEPGSTDSSRASAGLPRRPALDIQ